MELLRHSHADALRLLYIVNDIIVYHHGVIYRSNCLALRIYIHQAVVRHVRISLLIHLGWNVLPVTTTTLDYRLGHEVIHSSTLRCCYLNLIWFRRYW